MMRVHEISNIVIFGVHNSQSYGLNGSFGLPKKKICINISKVRTKSCLSLHYNGDNTY